MESPSRLELLDCAQLSSSYFIQTSAIYEHPFGAIAELVDNAVDANARNIYIDYDKREGTLRFEDDGCGMDKREALNVIILGYSEKKTGGSMIGRFGIGFKSGTMSLGKDVFLLTKKDSILTILMLSRNFHESLNTDKCFVPVVSFRDGKAFLDSGDSEDKHNYALHLICKFSRKSEQELLSEFASIKGTSGTIVLIKDLRKLPGGETALEFASPNDILTRPSYSEIIAPFGALTMESLREFLSVLYMTPKIYIYLRKKKVHTMMMRHMLSHPREYEHIVKGINSAAKSEQLEMMNQKRRTEEEVANLKSEIGLLDARKPIGTNLNSAVDLKNCESQRRIIQRHIEKKEEAINDMQCSLSRFKGASVPLRVFVGVHRTLRHRAGCYLYSNGRLILAAAKNKLLAECAKDRTIRLLGVSCVLDIPHHLLKPSPSKQSFESSVDAKKLLDGLSDILEHYYKMTGLTEEEWKDVWKKCGYRTQDWSETPSLEREARLEQYEGILVQRQCCACREWRLMSHLDLGLQFPPYEEWICDESLSQICYDQLDDNIKKQSVNDPIPRRVREMVTAKGAASKNRKNIGRGKRTHSSASPQPSILKDSIYSLGKTMKRRVEDENEAVISYRTVKSEMDSSPLKKKKSIYAEDDSSDEESNHQNSRSISKKGSREAKQKEGRLQRKEAEMRRKTLEKERRKSRTREDDVQDEVERSSVRMKREATSAEVVPDSGTPLFRDESSRRNCIEKVVKEEKELSREEDVIVLDDEDTTKKRTEKRLRELERREAACLKKEEELHRFERELKEREKNLPRLEHVKKALEVLLPRSPSTQRLFHLPEVQLFEKIATDESIASLLDSRKSKQGSDNGDAASLSIPLKDEVIENSR